ncbi:PREDICTED: mediator of DNA damage checkpoint protein 1 isoform X3 [Colobus angolensis palliatus]|uniref:mediator of DNA damage checkpoint protein 1 isoform X3 n=1 Tax=Colobus angolensis palliatus TaxID=336983 RepID=UPI0005F39BD6|nr:PREDICTED: mediator of DNA damage checkpoint protein 1 isoform X3 [Colobus angolensis palliatus]
MKTRRRWATREPTEVGTKDGGSLNWSQAWWAPAEMGCHKDRVDSLSMGHPTFPTCQRFPFRVAYFQIMEDTQAIDWDIEEEEETEQSSESLRCNVEPVGRLHIFSGAHGPEKDFPLHLGKNVVGRMPDCSVALPFPSISKQHAEIEILAWDKAPILRDCGSLNGTQILRPPKVLSPGVSHRLRDQELILFADLLCQYHRLDVSLPFVSRGPLTVEETPRVQGGTQPQRLLLAEDSEEEVDFLSERRVVKKSRTTSSPVAMIVPESDEEGHSPVLGGPGPPFAFNLNSDTDAEEGQQSATEEASSAARRGATIEAEQSEAEVVTEIQLEKDQPSVKERDNDTKVRRGAGNGVVLARIILERSQPPGEDSDTDVDDDSRPPGRPAEVHLEKAQPFGFIDSDTDAEEVGIPATPVVVPMKKRKIFHGVGTRGPGAPGLSHLQEGQAGSDTDVEEGKAPQAVPLEKSQASMVINSDTDDEEEVSAALTLARLKESEPAVWNRDAEEDMAHHVVLLQRSQTTTGRDSDTDVEEEELPVENAETVPKAHTKIRALVRAHSEKDQPPFGDSDDRVEADKSSPGIHLERSQASITVDINTKVEEEVPPGSAIVRMKKHQVSVEGTNQTDVKADGGPAKLLVVSLEEAWPPHGDCETDAEEGTSLAASAVADVRRSQLPAEGDAGAEWTAACLKQERAYEVGTQGGSPVAQVEQDLPTSRENLTDLVVDTDVPGESTQPQREGAQVPRGREREQHVGRTKGSEDNCDDSEDPDLQATQCFLENQGLEAVQSMEDEPTQAFMLTPPQELGPSHCSFQTTGLLNCKMPPTEKASRIRAATKASRIQKVEPTGRSRFTPELQPKASQSRKRSLAIMDSPPHQKQPQRGEVSQKTVIIKEEEEDTAEKPGKEEDVMTPKPGKRKRDRAEEEPNRIPNRSLRRTKLNQESTAPKVLFTGVVDALGERAVLALGGSLAGSAAEASHLVTDRIRRTVKFLCALGRGIPILSLDWLHQSRKAGCFLPPDEYVVTDPEQEKNFGFSLQDALSRARERRLLEGYEIYVTPGVQPPPPQMGEIITCCGGTYLPSMPRSYKPQRVVITCPQDFPRCSVPLRVGLPLLSPEFLLTGVLKQEAKPEAFVLSPLSST